MLPSFPKYNLGKKEEKKNTLRITQQHRLFHSVLLLTQFRAKLFSSVGEEKEMQLHQPFTSTQTPPEKRASLTNV